MAKRLILLLTGVLLAWHLGAQTPKTYLYGKLTDKDGSALVGASVYSSNLKYGTTTDVDGNYQLELPPEKRFFIKISHLGFVTLEKQIRLKNGQQLQLDLQLETNADFLRTLEVTADREELRDEAGIIEVDPLTVKTLPSAFQDFTKILVTLPGVYSNNELSSTYSVRGGNFDENLVYVNNIPVYRSFLANTGRQEGLSFVNPDLVGNIVFSAGGWQPKYGDALSSVLAIEYKKPKQFSGSVSAGLLSGTAHVEGSSKNGRVSYVAGIRHKDSRYILNTLETTGQFLPVYTDFQSFVNFDLTPKSSNRTGRTQLGWLFGYSRNRFLTLPTTRQTDFGSIQASFRFLVAFEGRESLNYDTYQSGINLSHWVNDRWKTELILSGVQTMEREFFEVEGRYRLCDVNTNPGASTFNECMTTRARGTVYESGRNRLEANLINVESRNEVYLGDQVKLEFGLGFQQNRIDDVLREFAFLDSAGFSSVTERTFNELDVEVNQTTQYTQLTYQSIDSMHSVTAGYRLNYWSFGDQLLFSPRIQYAFRPRWKRNTVFKLAGGVYNQPPFYRELRNRAGDINPNIQAQESWHIIGSFDYVFSLWGRPFKLLTEAYYKRGSNIIPYEVDNVQIRYYGENSASAFATGIDFRVNGQFVKGAESWFSLGILSTQEDIVGDGRGFIRRPSNQVVNLGIYFEDHLPSDPSWRVYLNLLFGSGLPIGPPGDDALRSEFIGDEYYRADIGISKVIKFGKKDQFLSSLWIRAEVLNAFAADNTISYNWIETLFKNAMKLQIVLKML